MTKENILRSIACLMLFLITIMVYFIYLELKSIKYNIPNDYGKNIHQELEYVNKYGPKMLEELEEVNRSLKSIEER